MRKTRIGLGVWLARLTTVAVVLAAAASMYKAFWAPFSTSPRLRTFSQLQKVADVLRREPDPAKRDASISSEDMGVDAGTRSLAMLIPTNARVFALDMLGPKHFKDLMLYYYMTYYLYPREVVISLGQSPVFQVDGFTGRDPASAEEELKQAGYDFAVKLEPDRTVSILTVGRWLWSRRAPNPNRYPRATGRWHSCCRWRWP